MSMQGKEVNEFTVSRGKNADALQKVALKTRQNTKTPKRQRALHKRNQTEIKNPDIHHVQYAFNEASGEGYGMPLGA